MNKLTLHACSLFGQRSDIWFYCQYIMYRKLAKQHKEGTRKTAFEIYRDAWSGWEGYQSQWMYLSRQYQYWKEKNM